MTGSAASARRPLNADGLYVCLPSSPKPAHLPCRDLINPTQPKPSDKGEVTCLPKKPTSTISPHPPTPDCRWAEPTLEHPVTLMLQVRNQNPHQAATLSPGPVRKDLIALQPHHPVFRCPGIDLFICLPWLEFLECKGPNFPSVYIFPSKGQVSCHKLYGIFVNISWQFLPISVGFYDPVQINQSI